MIDLSPAQWVTLFTGLASIALVGQLVMFVFGPTFYISRAPNDLIIHYFIKILRLTLLKLLNVVFLIIISSLCFPLLYIGDYILMSYFDISIAWNIYDVFFMALVFTILLSSIFILIEEFILRRSGKLELYTKGFRLNTFNNSRVNLDMRLRGIRLYLDTGEDFVAHTYGGILIPPRIVISKHLLSPGWQNQLLAVLLHELNHIERRDTIWSLITVCYDRIVVYTLKILLFPFKLVKNIPILNLIYKLAKYLVDRLYDIWRAFLGLGSILSRLSEEFADTEVYGLVPAEYLMEALNDCQDQKVRHYAFLRNEVVAQEIINREQTKIKLGEYKIDFSLKKLLSRLYQTHPPMYKRWFMGGSFSSRLKVEETHRSSSRYAPFIAISLGVAVLLYITMIEYKKMKTYQLKDKDILKYIKYLERKEL